MKKYFLLFWLLAVFFSAPAREDRPEPEPANGNGGLGKTSREQFFVTQTERMDNDVALLPKGNKSTRGFLNSAPIPTVRRFLPVEMTHAQLKELTNPPAGAKRWCSDCGLSGENLVYDGISWSRINGPAGTNYYVSEKNGNDDSNGLTPATPWKTLKHVQNASFAPGDSILFERGSYFFGTIEIKSQGTANNPIVYGTYGNGPKPVFIGGIEQRQPSDWTPYYDVSNNPVPNVWQNNNPIFSMDVGNIIFNDDEEFGVKKMSQDGPSLLKNQGDFWYDFNNRRVLLYSQQNPAIYYTRNIRCVLGINAIEYNSGDVDYYTLFDNLEFRYYGKCVVEKRGSHCSYRNLNISYIGGADLWGSSDPNSDPTQRYLLRFGNGLQMWQGVHDVTITGCNIDNVYDAGISPQSDHAQNEDPPYKIYNLFIRNNVISNCEWSFEFWVRGQNPTVHDVYFEHNTCVRAGQGWAHNQRWGWWSNQSIPDPNGVHVRLETFKCPTSNVFIRNNIFYGATDRLFWMEFPDDVINNPGFVIDYNCYFKTGNEFFGSFCDAGCQGGFTNIATLNNWQIETNKDLHSIYADPLFVCAYDYQLQASSPAIGHALDVGFGKDIGAYPYIENTNNVKPGKLFFKTAFGTDGKLIGTITECGLNKLYRYNIDGMPDTTFGNGGVVVIDSVTVQNKVIPIPDFKNTNSLYDLTIDNNDRIIVAEIFQNNFSIGAYSQSYRLTRYNSNGNLDNSFGTNGSAEDIYSHRVDDPTMPIFHFGQIAIQSDNKPVLTYGYWLRTNNTYHTTLLRLNENGTPDLPFNTNSDVSVVATGYLPQALVIQHNGRIVIQVSDGTSVPMVGVSANGTVDKSFGIVGNGFSSPFGAGVLAVTPDDALLLARNNGTIIRTTPDGIFDFRSGIQNLPFPVKKLITNNADKNFAGGKLNGDFALARFNGIFLDQSFGKDGIATLDFGTEEGIENMALIGNTIYAYGNGILSSFEVVCTPPTFLNGLQIVKAASCAGNDGALYVIPTSGTAPFLYSKDGGLTYVSGPDVGYSFEGLTAGTYQLRLKDANGCESEVEQKIVGSDCPVVCTPPTFLNGLQIVKAASCAGNDGALYVIPTSGTAPFLYSKDGGLTYVSGPDVGYSFEGLTAGTYQLRLKDANGCESEVITKEVAAPGCPINCSTPPTLLNSGAIVGHATCGKSDGALYSIPTSGTAPYQYSKDGGATYVSGPGAGYTFQNLSPGTYQLRIKDASGCESDVVEKTVLALYGDCSTLVINNSKTAHLLHENSRPTMMAYPNPSTGKFKLQIHGLASDKVHIQVLNSKGQVIEQRRVNVKEGSVIDFDLASKAKGLYLIRVIRDKGTQMTKVLLQ